LTFYYFQYLGSANTCSLVTSVGVTVVSAFLPSVVSPLASKLYQKVSIPNITPLAGSQALKFAFYCGDSSVQNAIVLDDVLFQKQSYSEGWSS
jgi:hypothetical protein